KLGAGESNGTGKWISHKGRAVHKRARLALSDTVADFVVGQRRRQPYVTAREPFTQAHNVRADIGVFTGKEFAGPAKACSHFIRNQEHVVFIAQFTDSA